MKRTLLVAILVGMCLTVGCNSTAEGGTTLPETSESLSTDTTTQDDGVDTIQTTTGGDATLQETNQVASETTAMDVSEATTTDDTTTNATTTTDTPTATDTVEGTQPTDAELDYPIPTSTTSSYVTQDMCLQVSEYFQSMLDVDVDTFQAKQLSAYNAFMDEYLSENDSSLQEMLSTYYDNFLNSTGDEEAAYTDCTFDAISLDYPNDVDSILNTMTYIDQLDEITEEREDYTLSSELTAYYQLDYAIDYTLSGDGLEDYSATKNGSILVLEMDGALYLVMLS